MLRSNGHTQAYRYPLWMLFDESDMVRRRDNKSYATTALLVQMAICSVLGGKEAHKSFSGEIERLIK